ncbi:hypothetical protein [Desulfoscipio gibsoniae]|uniref:Uncharacterized protein n=1 Tax=Desulfoscipio gibsoniae DSM 7213 TaxID=767817 RepID=R4KQ91_9FIRM|nr:hypothetical protein [Desulfoscipio gibsoniae]AGL01811.1 hypothetical protein Desgi_2397 [Desulfoscipio gibsoniae DSM 7213]
MYQTEMLSEVHAHGSNVGHVLSSLSNRQPVRLLASVPEVQVTKGVGQISSIDCTEKMAAALQAGDRIVLGKGDNRVYTIGTVMGNAGDNAISIRYDIFNHVGVAVEHSDQGYRILSQEEFDMIIIKLVRGY